jgi:UDP-N-acetylglucosamine 2-epimerase (non-hydrolysing)
MLKLAIIVGTRPEIIRLSSTIKRARECFDTVLIHTGQNYDVNLNDIFFRDLSLSKPDYCLDCSRESVGATVGDIIAKSYKLFSEIKPDAVLILGDTNSCLCAYSAKRLKIPVFHIEAGNRCFDPAVPEETNRKIIDHISDVNMCYMEHAKGNLLREGLSSQYTFVVGSPMREVLNDIYINISMSDILSHLQLLPNGYFVVSMHREENLNFKLVSAIECINNVAQLYDKPVIFTVHPRTRKVLVEKKIILNKNIILSEPFGLIDYCCLQKNAICVISDSGTVTEESSILEFPAILLRDSTEHPEGIESGNIIMGDVRWAYFKSSLLLAMKKTTWNHVASYDDTDFSHKICSIISGYIGNFL